MSIDFFKSLYYELISYFVLEKRKNKITGKCSKCGNCCRNIRAKGLKNEKDLKFMQFIFPWYKYFYISNIDDNGELILSCKHLKEDNTCKIYNFRPLICRKYPKSAVIGNYELPDNCGFKITSLKFKDYL